jgi:hypothetical protein
MVKKILLASLLVFGAFLQSLAVVQAQTTITLYPVADNYTDSKYPILGRYGRTTVLYAGNSYDHAQNIWGSERIYIRFNLTELPRNSLIVQATLRLWQYFPPNSSQTYEAHRVLGDWDETSENWNSQPSWSPTKTSETVAPPRGAQGAEVPVDWDITSDVGAWYSGEARNYGTMIKAVNEDHARDASSGFWSREYPVEELKPRLVIVLQGNPSLTYVVSVSVAGLPGGVISTITVDGLAYGSVSLEAGKEITFDKGTAHNIAVSQLLPASPDTRYRCEDNQTSITAAGSHTFQYTAEYLVEFSTEPSEMFETPPVGWYPSGASLTVRRTGPDLIMIAPGARSVFDGWYLNSRRLANDLGTIILDGPGKVEGRYRTEYCVNVTSSIGKTEGSGWYAKDSVASFSIESSTIGAEGPMGLLGLKRSFSQWVGSDNLIGAPVDPRGSVVVKGPTTIEAMWQDDWSVVFTNLITILLAVIAAGVAVIIVRRRRSQPLSVMKKVVKPNERPRLHL